MDRNPYAAPSAHVSDVAGTDAAETNRAWGLTSHGDIGQMNRGDT
jgi:hypothetical protein